MVLGVWTLIFLFLGFPPVWDKIFALIVGVLIIVIAFKSKPPVEPISSDRIPYMEHKSAPPEHITSTDTSSS
jgi:hypothetical protein